MSSPLRRPPTSLFRRLVSFQTVCAFLDRLRVFRPPRAFSDRLRLFRRLLGMPEVASTAAEPSLRLRFIPERLSALAFAGGNLAKMLPVARALLPHCEREGYLSVPEAHVVSTDFQQHTAAMT